MGRIVYASAMCPVPNPPYYEKNVGPHGKRMVEELIAVVGEMGRELSARRPDALVIVADDHLNVFSFDAVPAMCVRIGRSVSRMSQEGAIEFDRALDGLAERYPVHEDLANRILEDGLEAGFDFAASWSAPLDHAFLSPLTALYGTRPMPPLVPFWVNCFVAPLPPARRCFAAGQHIARVVADGPWNVAVIATGGLSHFPELSLARVGTSDLEFERRVIGWGHGGPLVDRSSARFRTTRAGSVARRAGLVRLRCARGEGGPVDPAALAARVRAAVDEIVRKQVEAGLDVVNDGEMSKPSYATYIKDRLHGFGGESHPLVYQDLAEFPELARRVFGDPGRSRRKTPACNGPVGVRDPRAAQADAEVVSAALARAKAAEGFLSAASPGVISLFF